jgi:tetratricopeptide (TPR) repeat protein
MAAWLVSVALAQTDSWKDLMTKASVMDDAGDYAGALSGFRDAVHAAEASGDPRLPIAINSLANTNDELGRYSEAEQLFRRALSITAKGGVWNPDYALTLANLGAHYVEVGPRDKAEPLHTDCPGSQCPGERVGG